VLLKLYCSLEPLSEKAMEPKASQAKVVSTAATTTTTKTGRLQGEQQQQ